MGVIDKSKNVLFKVFNVECALLAL